MAQDHCEWNDRVAQANHPHDTDIEKADFDEFMRNRAQPSRNPSGTSVGATECACGVKKGVARWARMSRGKPQGAKCWDCGSSTEWKRKVGYTNKTRTARENRKTTSA